MEKFNELCYDYPLIFVEQEHSIIFFNIEVKLDQIQYSFLYELVEDATQNDTNKGLSPTELFKKVRCIHTKEKSCNSQLTDYDRDDERMRDIKRRIKLAIKKTHQDLIKKSSINIDGILCEPNCSKVIGISETTHHGIIEKYFIGDIKVNEESPYYNFEIDSAIKLLIINQRNKDKKYTTEFKFKK